MAVRYVAGDGTGDYDADGSYDQVPINQALKWASDHPGNEIYLKGPFTYDIFTTVLIGSDTKFSGDSTAVLRLRDSCEWTSGTPIIGQIGGTGTVSKNIEISGFQIDANEGNLYGVGGRVRGQGYYNAIHIQGQKAKPATGINIHDLKIYDSMGDGPRLVFCDDVAVHDCTMWNLQHCSVFCIDSTNLNVYNNDIQAITCSGIRFDHGRNGAIYNNNIRDWTGATHAPKRGEYGVQIGNQPPKYKHTALTNNIEIYNNTINVGGPGIQIEDYLKTAGTQAQNVNIHNNIIKGGDVNWRPYFAGITIYSWGNGITISKNTIDGSSRAGILGYSTITSGVKVYVKNNNILNTVKAGSDGGWGIWNRVPSSMKIFAQNNYLSGNAAGKYKNVTIVSESNTSIEDAIPGGGQEDPDTPDVPNIPDEPDEPNIPDVPDEPDTPEPPNDPDEPYEPVDPVLPNDPVDSIGYQGIMIPSGDGHYIFQKLSTPVAGDKILLFPMPGGDYALLKLVESIKVGENVTVIPDGNGSYYLIE